MTIEEEMMRLGLHFYSFERYQEEAVLFDRIMPFTPFCAIFGWLRAATQYHLAPIGWLTCRIPWQQLSHLGDIMAVPPQRLPQFSVVARSSHGQASLINYIQFP